MAWGPFKSRSTEPAPQCGDDASATELLDCVVQELVAGRARSEIVHELVRHRWQRSSATQFCAIAQEIAQEVRHSPDQRSACARRGLERIQASWGWIFSGLIIALILWRGGKDLNRYTAWSLLVIGYGLVELISGLALWWPHKEFLPATNADAATRTPQSR